MADDAYNLYSLSAEEIVQRNVSWPNPAGSPIANPDPDIVWLLIVAEDPPGSGDYNQANEKIVPVETIDVEAETCTYSWTIVDATEDEILAGNEAAAATTLANVRAAVLDYFAALGDGQKAALYSIALAADDALAKGLTSAALEIIDNARTDAPAHVNSEGDGFLDDAYDSINSLFTS